MAKPQNFRSRATVMILLAWVVFLGVALTGMSIGAYPGWVPSLLIAGYFLVLLAGWKNFQKHGHQFQLKYMMITMAALIVVMLVLIAVAMIA